ncbi:hypothetical protein GCM10010975_18130 [Comamonas phosphati]|nr:hypothetical protein GCM10010975_18130 [Comamonas phosphati]
MQQLAAPSRRSALRALLLLPGLAMLETAQARKGQARDPEKSGGRRASGGRVRILNIRSSSEESSLERDRRLYRECQGRPNSGACSGYTQSPPGRRY